MAVKDINTKFENVRCIVFLRSDIYDQLQFFDKDKLRGDEESILWTQETLPELILARARISTMNHQMSLDDFLSVYFPSRIKGIAASKFILSHTLMRPRDAIQLCNLCTDLARRESLEVISEECVLKALDVYSSWKLNDLIGEYTINYPFLNDLLILFSNTSYVIPRKRIKLIYGRVEEILKDRYPDYIPSLYIDSILNILYGVGFLGIERNRSTFYYYENPGTVEVSDKFFVIHPAFRYALKSTSSVNIQPYHSDSDVRQQSRYLSEITRRRSPVRNTFERSRSGSKELTRWIRRFNQLLVSLKAVRELPSEVLSEIGQELSEIASEFEMLMDSKRIDRDQLQLNIVGANRYLLDLSTNLENNGYININSTVSYQIREIIEMSGDIRDVFYYDW
ncbi:MAG: hypothetical protein F6K01_29755 [Okeania sp. SIO1I7]|nr:hypothetical protein [Okeania sp. SIO1I7]NET29364.1 hypothetical protein [Okeania sp. SIO1I7]